MKNKESKCDKCGKITKELFDAVNSTRLHCKDCRSSGYARYDSESANTKKYIPKKYK